MFENNPIKKILFDKLVEIGRLPSNPSKSTIQTINDISNSDALKILKSVGYSPVIKKRGGGMMQGIQTLRNGGTARDKWRGGRSQRHQQTIKDRNKAIQGLADQTYTSAAGYRSQSGRDRGIATQYALSRKDKEKRLQQSVGSLDRRINKAMEAGNLDQAKDLRSRQNVFSKRLANQRMLQSGSFAKDSSGRPIRDSSGNPIGDTRGASIRDFSMQADFIDPTRRLFYKYPDKMAQMYPLTSYFNRGGLYGMAMNKFFPQSEQQRLKAYQNTLRYPGIGGIYGEGQFPAQRYDLPYSIRNEDLIRQWGQAQGDKEMQERLLEEEKKLNEPYTNINDIKETKQLRTGINTINQPFRSEAEAIQAYNQMNPNFSPIPMPTASGVNTINQPYKLFNVGLSDPQKTAIIFGKKGGKTKEEVWKRVQELNPGLFGKLLGGEDATIEEFNALWDT